MAARDASQPDLPNQLGSTLKRALAERGARAQDLAAEVGVSAASISAWLSGATDVPTTAMPALARATGLSENLLYELGGHMPGPGRAASFQDQAASEFRRAVGDLRRWVDRWELASDLPPAARVAGSILANAPELEVTARPWFRGRKSRAHHATWLAVRSQDGAILHVDDLPRPVRDVMNETGTTARGDRPVDGWEDAPGLVLFSPQHERTRPPALVPREAGPTCILMLGVPYAHAETVAGYVADELGYGYANAAVVAQERYGFSRDEDPGRGAQNRVVADWLHRIEDNALTRYVLTWSDLVPLESNLDAVVASAARVVHITASKSVLELGENVWHIPSKGLAKEQTRVAERLADRDQDTATYPVRPRGHAAGDAGRRNPQPDDVWDAAASCARRVLADLNDGYSLGDTGGS